MGQDFFLLLIATDAGNRVEQKQNSLDNKEHLLSEFYSCLSLHINSHSPLDLSFFYLSSATNNF